MSTAFRIGATILYLGAGLYGLYLIVPLIYAFAGALAVIIGLLLFPFTLLAVPLFEALAHHQWFLVELNYGTPFICGLLMLAADKLDRA